MYDRLKCDEIDMMEAPTRTYSSDEFDRIESRITEIESLMEEAYCVGALVDWNTLKRNQA